MKIISDDLFACVYSLLHGATEYCEKRCRTRNCRDCFLRTAKIAWEKITIPEKPPVCLDYIQRAFVIRKQLEGKTPQPAKIIHINNCSRSLKHWTICKMVKDGILDKTSNKDGLNLFSIKKVARNKKGKNTNENNRNRA